MTDAPVNFVETEDGSLTCLDPETGELYHNRAGAVTEALCTYLEPSGAAQLLADTGRLHLLDICFGLGYNTWVLLASLAVQAGLTGTISVLALERDSDIVAAAPAVLADPRLAPVKDALETTPGAGQTRFTLPNAIAVELNIQVADLRAAVPALAGNFDLVFHDPFSPRRVPELWTVDLFRHYHRLLVKQAGKVLTYSSAAAVRGALLEAGFELWRTQAVGGKSGGTLAAAPGAKLEESVLFPLSYAEQEKVFSSSAVPYRDPGFTDSRADILKRRALEQENRSVL